MGIAIQQNMIASQENINNSDNAKNPNQRQKIGTQTKKYLTQLPVLKDISKCMEAHLTEKKERIQLSKSQIDSVKITRKYDRINRV